MSGFLDRTRQRTADQRQAVATALLSREAVKEAIGIAAAAAQDQVLLYPAAPVRFRTTAAAAEAVEWLTKMGFRTSWTDHPRTLQTPATTPAGDALSITWP